MNRLTYYHPTGPLGQVFDVFPQNPDYAQSGRSSASEPVQPQVMQGLDSTGPFMKSILRWNGLPETRATSHS
jgi:hypothetical protein